MLSTQRSLRLGQSVGQPRVQSLQKEKAKRTLVAFSKLPAHDAGTVFTGTRTAVVRFLLLPLDFGSDSHVASSFRLLMAMVTTQFLLGCVC
jgi:hypothetical protein